MRIYLKLLAVGAMVLVGTLALAGAEKPDGAALFAKRCAACHGLDGKGLAEKKTPDFTDPKWQASFKAGDYVVKLKERRDRTDPPASVAGLKDEEIQAIVAYIRTLGSEKK
jgi:cytochrome c oxidase cbb3-type subunit 3